MSIHLSRQALIDDYGDDDGGSSQAGNSGAGPSADINGTINHTANEFNRRQELRKLAKSIHAPTSNDDVCALLRHLGEPVTYFAENRVDRRDRLQKILTTMYSNKEDISFIVRYGGSIRDGTPDDAEMREAGEGEQDQEEQDEEEEEFYTPGDDDLLAARQYMATYSFQQAQKRIALQVDQSNIPLEEHVKTRRQIYKNLSEFALYGTQSGFDRPVSAVSFSPNDKLIATGDWSGIVKVLEMPNLSTVSSFHGHSEKVCGVAWHPNALNTQTASELNLISGGLEGNVKLWSLDQGVGELGTLVGHEARVCKVDVHPSGRYAASASFDYTWRLWDLEHQKELMMQEGHSKEVFAVKFQCDGALVGSAGLDAIARVWDLRTGKTIMVLDGHARGIYSLDFSPNGYQVATASADNSVMIWDIRQVKSIFTIPAHTKMVSDVKFHHGTGAGAGSYLTTASADRSIKIWSSDNWVLQKTLPDNDRVLALDVSRDMAFIASGTSDRYLKIWAQE